MEEGAGGEPSGQQPQQQPTPPPRGGGNAGEAALLEKISRLESDLNQERTKIKSLATERDTFKSKASDYEVKDKKRTALDTALGGIGEDFTIDAEARNQLSGLIADLADGPELDARVNTLVTLAKRPKAADSLTTPFSRPGSSTGSATGVPDKQPMDYTHAELSVMSRNEPDRYKEVRAARDATIGFGKNLKG